MISANGVNNNNMFCLANILTDMADMEVDKVADMVADMEVDHGDRRGGQHGG